MIRNWPTKSCLLDPWQIFLIKECSAILLSVTKLFNCLLSDSCVPDDFKTAVVTINTSKCGCLGCYSVDSSIIAKSDYIFLVAGADSALNKVGRDMSVVCCFRFTLIFSGGTVGSNHLTPPPLLIC